ncbi:hypothetical protein DC889_21545 [Vibrio parahaemolyticus]|nr:hypothetical protein [Vibrio parahaemolyticus]
MSTELRVALGLAGGFLTLGFTAIVLVSCYAMM